MGKSRKRAWRDTTEGRRHLKNKNYTKFNEVQVKTVANSLLREINRKTE